MYFAVYFGVFEDDPRQVNTSVRQHAHPAQEDQISRLQPLGFRLSPSQLCTPADGNCMYHVLADQSSFVDHREARCSIVKNILPVLENESIFWDGN